MSDTPQIEAKLARSKELAWLDPFAPKRGRYKKRMKTVSLQLTEKQLAAYKALGGAVGMRKLLDTPGVTPAAPGADLDTIPTSWELSYGSDDEEEQPTWRVHRRQGSTNDREWVLLGTGKTPSAAIAAARGVPARCPACNGNDADMPCAFPEGGQPGCLRDKRIAVEKTCPYCCGHGFDGEPDGAGGNVGGPCQKCGGSGIAGVKEAPHAD